MSVGIIFDIVIVLIILFSVYRGYKKGIVNIGIRLFSVIVSILASLLLCIPLTNLIIDTTEIDENMEKAIVENLASKEDNKTEENNSITEVIESYTKSIAKDAQNAMTQNFAKTVSYNIIRVGVIVILFILIRMVLIILQLFTDVLTKIPIIKQCNEIAGIIYSLIIALVIIYVVLAIVFYISTISGHLAINNMIESSYVTKFIYNTLFYK